MLNISLVYNTFLYLSCALSLTPFVFFYIFFFRLASEWTAASLCSLYESSASALCGCLQRTVLINVYSWWRIKFVWYRNSAEVSFLLLLCWYQQCFQLYIMRHIRYLNKRNNIHYIQFSKSLWSIISDLLKKQNW